MDNTQQQQQPPPNESYLKRLTIFFGLVYFCQVMGQDGGLFLQPLNIFFEKVLHYDEVRTTDCLAVLTIPWMIKPLYGLLSDFIPIFGFRRKSYLIMMGMLSTYGFMRLRGANTAEEIIFCMMLSSVGTAFCDVITDALMVEQGQAADHERSKHGQEPYYVKHFQSTQWFWASIASVASGVLGGQLCQRLSPADSLHTAALICTLFPMCVIVMAWFWIVEEKSQFNGEAFKSTSSGYMAVFKSKALWIVAGFLFFWNFSPSFGTPFLRYQEHVLKFDQAFIGVLNTVSSVGSVIGAWIFGKFLAGRYSTKKLMILSIILGTVATLGYLLLVGRNSALVLNLLMGIASMIANLTVLGLAAENCPKHAEGFTFAALMSVINFSAKASGVVGSRLYKYVFASQLTPLIWVSALFTAAAIFLVPFLPEAPKDDGDPPPKEIKP